MSISWESGSYIGSHDSGIIVNGIGYKSRRELHEDKVGRGKPFKPTVLTRAGLALESLILEDYRENVLTDGRWSLAELPLEEKNVRTEGLPWRLVDTSGDDVPERYKGKLHVQSTRLPYFRGSPDDLVVLGWDVVHGVDAKMVADWDTASQIKNGILPDKMKLQGRHFCVLMGLDKWDFHCCLISEYMKMVTLTYECRLDMAQRMAYMAEITKFWGNIQADNPPPFDGSEGDAAPSILASTYGGSGQTSEATDEQVDMALNAIRAQSLWKKSEKEFRKLQGQLGDSMGMESKKLELDGEWFCTRQKNGAFKFSARAKEMALEGESDEA
jgi:hypothetical protein